MRLAITVLVILVIAFIVFAAVGTMVQELG